MLESLKEKVCQANKKLVDEKLVILTWGNASAFDKETKLVVIKPSGVPYNTMKAEDMVVVDLYGNIIEGACKPSSDIPTHLEIYSTWGDVIGGVVHTPLLMRLLGINQEQIFLYKALLMLIVFMEIFLVYESYHSLKLKIIMNILQE